MSRVPSRAALRREEILDAAETIFARDGYHATGIADIASELGIGHGTFYRYFQNKRDIALHVFDRVLARFAEIGLAADPTEASTLEEYREQTRRILLDWLALGESEPHLLRFFHEQSAVIDSERLAAVVETYVVHTARFLQNGVDKEFLRADLDVRATAEILVALMLEGTRRAATMTDPADRRRWCDAGMALMFDGVKAR